MGDGTTEHEVTAVGTTTLTITPAVPTGGYTDGDIVKPSVPAHTDLGDPISGRLDNATLDGTNVKTTATEVTIDNTIEGIEEKDDGIYPATATDAGR